MLFYLLTITWFTFLPEAEVFQCPFSKGSVGPESVDDSTFQDEKMETITSVLILYIHLSFSIQGLAWHL